MIVSEIAEETADEIVKACVEIMASVGSPRPIASKEWIAEKIQEAINYTIYENM
jgi:hypothetical protein